MKHHPIVLHTAAATLALALGSAMAATVTFETVLLDPKSGYWNGSDLSGSITVDGTTFNNSYNSTYDSWSGFAISKHTDSTTPGWGNQYSAYPGSGAGGSAQYALGYNSSTSLTFSGSVNLDGGGASFTNTTYAGLDMRDGSGFSKKFGGTTGNDADWFLLTIKGYSAGVATGTTVSLYLADFRDAVNANDYIVNDWQFVDFSPLGTVNELRFSLSSSDNSIYDDISYMNTPAYFAMDNLTVIPEPSALFCSLVGLGLLARRRR